MLPPGPSTLSGHFTITMVDIYVGMGVLKLTLYSN